jgi:hypothetical protein
MDTDDVELVFDTENSEDPYFIINVVTVDGTLQLMGEMEIGSNHLVIRGLHIGGDAAVRRGWSKLRRLGRVILGQLNVDYIEIHGAIRTTGANPGRRPSIVRLSRAAEPGLSARC